eukprot:5456529-Prymnesium_polylepis.1
MRARERRSADAGEGPARAHGCRGGVSARETRRGRGTTCASERILAAAALRSFLSFPGRRCSLSARRSRCASTSARPTPTATHRTMALRTRVRVPRLAGWRAGRVCAPSASRVRVACAALSVGGLSGPFQRWGSSQRRGFGWRVPPSQVEQVGRLRRH